MFMLVSLVKHLGTMFPVDDLATNTGSKFNASEAQSLPVPSDSSN